MRTSMCGTSIVRRWSSRSPSHIRAGSPAWPGCQLISWLLSGMIMQSCLGISLARLWSDNGWLMMMMDDDDGWCWWMMISPLYISSWLYVHCTEIVAIMTTIMRRWEMRCDNDDRWMAVIICNLKSISYAYPSWLSSSSSSYHDELWMNSPWWRVGAVSIDELSASIHLFIHLFIHLYIIVSVYIID